MSAENYMQMALDLAAKGQGFTSPNPLVGAVVVKDGQVVGCGYHKAAGLPHAEINAIKDAKELARGADLYVSLEPCNHMGRTPPCTRAIIEAGISRVFVAMLDPNPKVCGGGCRFLKEQGIIIKTGILEKAAQKQNEFFIKFVKTGHPFVILKWAATLDGQIATSSGNATWVTGPAARQVGHQIRHAVDAVLVGIGTVKADNPSLTTRLDGKTGKDPIRVILDSRLSIAPDARLLSQKSNAITMLAAGKNVNQQKKDALEKKGIKILTIPLVNGFLDFHALLDQLGRLEITSMLIEGGGQVNASALKAGIVDKVVCFYGPKIFGGNDGVPVCMGKGPDLMKDSIQVKNIQAQLIDNDIMVEGYL